MMKNTVRGILGLVLTAAATWLAGYILLTLIPLFLLGIIATGRGTDSL